MKQVVGYPGYFYTDDGQVYSSRKSKNGSLKQMKIRTDGSVILCRGGQQKQIRVEDLSKLR